MNYYKDQLNKIITNGIFPPSIVVHGQNKDGNTKHLSLNTESAQVLVDWLTRNYLSPAKTYFVVENPEKEALTRDNLLATDFLGGKLLICLYSRGEAIRKARNFKGKAKMFKGTPNENEHYF